jgi:hypothetical protein
LNLTSGSSKTCIPKLLGLWISAFPTLHSLNWRPLARAIECFQTLSSVSCAFPDICFRVPSDLIFVLPEVQQHQTRLDGPWSPRLDSPIGTNWRFPSTAFHTQSNGKQLNMFPWLGASFSIAPLIFHWRVSKDTSATPFWPSYLSEYPSQKARKSIA